MSSIRKKQIKQNRKIRSLVLLTVAILLFIYITLSIVFGEKGLFRYLKLSSDRNHIMAENERIKKQNSDMQDQVEMMKKNPSAMEEIAREQGLTKEGEIIYKFDEDR
jgi:cell division protein FtsB